MNTLSQHTRAFTTGASIGTGGTRPADIRKLRHILDELDYLQSPSKAAPNYTAAIAEAVGRFQGDFGLQQDGVITPDGPTEQALNVAIVANRTGDKDTFNNARKAFTHLNRKGFSFVRDRSDFDALGAWHDKAGNRIGPGQIGNSLRGLLPQPHAALSSTSGSLVRIIFGEDATRAFGLGSGSTAPTNASSHRSANDTERVNIQSAQLTGKQGNAANGGTTSPTFGPGNTGQQHPESLGFKVINNSAELMRFYRHSYVEQWRREGKIQASKNMEHYLDGSGKPMRFTRDQARAFKPIRKLEQRVRRHFEQGEFVGKTQRNQAFNKRIRSLKDGKSLTHSSHNDADIQLEDSAIQYLGNDTDFALAFGRMKLRGDAEFTATRKGKTIHIQGSVTHKWEDTYDFEKGQVGAAGSLRLEKEMGAKPFPIRASWKQNFSGTVTLKNGELSNPNITWTDK
jgi:hypothetical protein